MPTLTANRVGNAIGFNSNFTTARQTANVVTDGTFSVTDGISYQFSAGRGGGEHTVFDDLIFILM